MSYTESEMETPTYTFYDSEGALYRHAWGTGRGDVWREEKGVWERGHTMLGYSTQLDEDRAIRMFGLTHEQLHGPRVESP